MNLDIKRCYSLLVCMAVLSGPTVSHATSRILATGGATQIEGQAGGGIVPWAVLTGYGSIDEFGAAAFGTNLQLDDYSLSAYGASVSYNNRVELSVAHQKFDTSTLADALGLPDTELRQNIYGFKLRLFGDLILEQLPQVTFGVQYKHHLDFFVPRAVGAVRDSDFEYYLSATKLWLAGPFDRNIFANATVRWTRANQGGLIGFGGDRDDDRELVFEGTAGIFLNRYIAVGAEYRQHPNNLGFTDQDDWFDVFVGIFPNKHVSIVGAYADLGTVATLDDQQGWYLSLEIAY